MTSPTTPSKPNASSERGKPRFRIQEAILILRQGKSHPHWREAAWHLIENAAKDTALLLEAQRDLLTQHEEPPWWQQHWGKLLAAGAGLVMVGGALWIVILEILRQCR